MLGQHAQWLARSGGRDRAGSEAASRARRCPTASRFSSASPTARRSDAAERPCRDVPLPGFIRYLADDLKALYWEGYMAV